MTILDSVAATAWSQFWQATAVIVVVAALTTACYKRRPHLAHVLWLLAFIKCLTPPIWSSPTSLFSWLQARASDVQTIPEPTAFSTIVETRFTAERALSELFASSESIDSSPGALNEQTTIVAIIAVSWLSGVVIFGGGVALRWLRLRHELKRSRLAIDPALGAQVANLARRLGVRRQIRLIVTASPCGPAAMGIWSPAILLPRALAGKGPAEREPILAHELIHFRRGDHVFGLLQMLVQVMWWFHPLIWWANRAASRVVERCCDEEVLAGLDCAPVVYARCLLDVLEQSHNVQAAPFTPGMRPAEVTALRLENIMKRANGFYRRTPRWCWALLTLALALVLPGGELVLSQDQPRPQVPPPAPPSSKADANVPASFSPPPIPKATAQEPSSKDTRMVDAIRLKYALAADAAVAINDFFNKRQDAVNSGARDGAARPVVTPEPISNSLFVSANSPDFVEIKRLVGAIDVFQKQFLFEVVVCEGEPVPTLHEAINKGTINVLSRPQVTTIENQTALVNFGKEIELPDGSGQLRDVGVVIQITPGRANDKQLPVRVVVGVSSANEDKTTLTKQHIEHSANMPLERPVRIRGGKTNSGKELWIVMTVHEIASAEQLDNLTNERRRERKVEPWPQSSK